MEPTKIFNGISFFFIFLGVVSLLPIILMPSEIMSCVSLDWQLGIAVSIFGTFIGGIGTGLLWGFLIGDKIRGVK